MRITARRDVARRTTPPGAAVAASRRGDAASEPRALAVLRRRRTIPAASSGTAGDDLRGLLARRSMTRSRPVPLRAEDALFLHAQTPMLCQQVGALVLLEPAAIGVDDLRAAMRQRIRGTSALRRRLQQPRNRWRRPCWIASDDICFEDRIRQLTLGQAGTPAGLDEVVDAFFSAPCDPYRSPWGILLVRGLPGGRAAVTVKVHHTLGDSRALIATLSKLLDPVTAPAAPAGAARPGMVQAGQTQAGAARPGMVRAHQAQARRPGAVRALRGLCHLAAAGNAPATSVCGPFASSRRRYVPLTLPAREIAITARRLDAGIVDLLLAMITESLDGLLRSRGEETTGRFIRITLPRTWPAAAGACSRSSGNRSAAVSLDLPLGPLPLAGRLAAARGQIEAHCRHGEPEAAALVLRAMNFMPPPVQRRAAARLYQRRWFNLLVSVFRGVRRSHRLLGARVEEVYPVLALADGVGLAVGAMTWERSLAVGILADAALVPDVDKLAAGLADTFRRFQAAAGRQVAAGEKVAAGQNLRLSRRQVFA